MNHQKSLKSFAFDDWMQLAESDPKAFEKQRRHVIDSVISNAPDKHRGRLEGLQWRIDMERKRSSTPLSACVRISSMMMDSVYGDTGLVSALHGRVDRKASPVATVLDISSHKGGE